MEKHKWTLSERAKIQALYESGFDIATIAKKIGLSFKSVQYQVQKLRLLKLVKPRLKSVNVDDDSAFGKSLTEDQNEAATSLVHEDAKTAIKRYTKLLKRVAVEDRIVAAFTNSIQNFKPNIPVISYKKKEGVAEAAVLCLSDSHIGQVVYGKQTFGYGHYNPWVFIERLFHIEERVISLMTGELTAKFDELNIFFLGDMIHGALNHGAEKNEAETIGRQFLLATWAFTQFIIRVQAKLGIQVRVRFAAVGNHGRFPGQHKMPTENTYSNLDGLLYSSIQQAVMMAGISANKIDIQLNENPGDMVDVKGSSFLLRHGDHLKGGDYIFGMPVHGMGKQVLTNLLKSNVSDTEAADYHIIGDKHRYFNLPLAKGAFIGNGCFTGYDNFATYNDFTPAEPIQLLFGVHPKVKKSWTYDIKLDLAKPLAKVPYDFPPNVMEILEPWKTK